MAMLNKETKKSLKPKLNDMFEELNQVLSKFDLGDFAIKEFKLEEKANPLTCPCGVESVILPSGKVVKRCKACPPV